MNLSASIVIELIVGFIGLISSTAGLASWLTALSIKHDLSVIINNLKQDAIVTRRRVKLLEQFAANCGFQRESLPAGEDTDL